jgi:hypothetical protein
VIIVENIIRTVSSECARTEFFKDENLYSHVIGFEGEVWFKDRKIHRDNGLPAIKLSHGKKYFYTSGNKRYQWSE